MWTIETWSKYAWVFLQTAFSGTTLFFVDFACSRPIKDKKTRTILVVGAVLISFLGAVGATVWFHYDVESFGYIFLPLSAVGTVIIAKIGNRDKIFYILFNHLNTTVALLFFYYASFAAGDSLVRHELLTNKYWVAALIYVAFCLVMCLIVAIFSQKYYLKVAKNLQKVQVVAPLIIVPITFIVLTYVNLFTPYPFYSTNVYRYNWSSVITVMGIAFVTYVSLLILCVHMGEYYDLYKIQKEGETKLSLWAAQVEAQDEMLKSIRKYDHDRRHHTAIALEFLETGDVEKAKEYLKEHLDAKNFSSTLVTYCNNYTVNCLLTYFANMAKKEGIEVDIQVYIPERLDVSDTELVGLFANLIENAIEANKNIQVEKKFLKIRCKYVDGAIRGTIENSCDNKLSGSSSLDTKFKTKKEIGGYGLQNVMDIVQKYNGMYDFDCKNGVYQTRIIMYVEQFAEDKRSLEDEN